MVKATTVKAADVRPGTRLVDDATGKPVVVTRVTRGFWPGSVIIDGRIAKETTWHCCDRGRLLELAPASKRRQ